MNQLADLFVDVRKSFFAGQIFSNFFVDPDVEREHLVVLLQGELGLGVRSNVGLVVDGESFHSTLRRNRIVILDWAVSEMILKSLHNLPTQSWIQWNAKIRTSLVLKRFTFDPVPDSLVFGQKNLSENGTFTSPNQMF